ncbi:glyoxalase-like domain protein [Clostridium magnum DSM 2767]|uniref:Glyoxalase-like domain protein n=1 Tax=Clostridium magnum DSM 2767 TaxID=1121326 RepID=A0A162RX55_9CLOT|nr:glyoxalase-like domain protein [Clostridium magnum DSM 2767]
MKFKLALLAVKDVNVSKQFYKELFNQEVILDLERNVTFSGGFAIQEDFAWLTDVPVNSVIEKSNNMELYFEVDYFGKLYKNENL